MEISYCTYSDKDNLLKALSLINSIVRNSESAKQYIICMDELSRLLINKLKIPNVQTIALHEIIANDELLKNSKIHFESLDNKALLTFSIIEYLIANSESEHICFVDSSTYFFASPEEIWTSLTIDSNLYKLSKNKEIIFISTAKSEKSKESISRIKHALLFKEISKTRSELIDELMTVAEYDFHEINRPAILFNLTDLTKSKITNYENNIYLDNIKLIAYNFLELKFINQFIIIPSKDPNTQLSEDVIQSCYVKYIEELYNSLVSVRGYLSDFSEGLNNKDLLTDQHTFIAFKSVFDELSKQELPYKTFDLGNNLRCYVPEQIVESINPTSMINSLNFDLDKIKGQNSLLEIMHNKKISREIKTLYIIGAHKFGELEVFNYIFPKLENIYLFEPIKTLYDYLKGYEEVDERIKVLNFAISDFNGIAEFNIADNEGASSSLYEYSDQKELPPFIKTIKKIEVQVHSLQTIIDEFKLSKPDMLFIDAQGAEFEILNSIKSNILPELIIIHSKVNKIEMFKGKRLLKDVISLLSPEFDYVGYTPLDAYYPNHGNALFVNCNYSSMLLENYEEPVMPANVSEKFKVSAIISTYNSEIFMRGCMQDLVEQTLFEMEQLEIIVIDSASSQSEQAIVREYQNIYGNEKIKYIRTEERVTLYKAWNIGINLAKGQYITNANTDDRHRKDALELMAVYLDNHIDTGLVYADQLITNKENDTFEDTNANQRWGWDEFDYSILEKRCIIGPAPMWRKSIHELYGYFHEEFVSAADYEFWLRIGRFVKFYRYPDILGLYYYNPNGLEHQGVVGKNETEMIRKEYSLTFQESTIPVSISINELNSLPYRKTMNISKVSVIMPTAGNRIDFIKSAISSVLNQSYNNLELIIINDGGEDFKYLIDEFNDSRIRYFHYAVNMGRSYARNFGINNAVGKYIAYLDDDDLYYENHLQTLVDFLECSGEFIAYTDAFRAEQVKDGDNYRTINREIVYSQDFDYDAILVGNFIPNLCIIHRKECTDLLGAFDESLHTHEDWDLWIKLSRRYKFYHIPTATCEFSWRTDGSSTTSSNRKDFIKTKEKIFKKYSQYSLNNAKVINMQSADLNVLKSELNYYDKPDSFSIIIPVFNNLTYTKNCIDSIIKTNNKKIPVELIVINNASTDGTAEYLNNLAAKKMIKLINNADNLAFSIACNQGAKISAGKYLIFLNNDTQVSDGWIDSLLKVFIEDENVAIQGAKLLYPNNTVQHCGVVYGYLSKTVKAHYHIYLNAPYDADRVCKSREFQMVTGACLAIRAKIFQEINGFDENYHFGHEDLDLCLKSRKAGYKVWYNAECTVVHYESITKVSINIKNYDRFYIDSEGNDNKNNTYFVEKWGDFIEIDDDKYYEEDRMIGLITNPVIKAEFLQRIELIIQELSKYIQKNDENRIIQLIDILFEKLISPKAITEYDVYNVSEQRLINAERFISDTSTNNTNESVTEANPLNVNEPVIESVNYIKPIEEIRKDKKAELLSNTTKKRILFVMYGYNETGGGTTFPKSVAKELSNRGYQLGVFYAMPKVNRQEPEYSMDIDFDGDIILYGLYNRPAIFTDQNHPEREINDEQINRKFREVLDDYKPELVHYHNFHGLTMSIADEVKLRNIPSLFTTHNYYIIDPNLYMINNDLSLWNNTDLISNSQSVNDNPEKFELYKQRSEKARKLINEVIDLTIPVSTRQKKLFEEFGCNSEKMKVVHQANSIVDKLSASETIITSQNRDIALPMRFGFIGGVMPHKGVHYIALAAQYFDKSLAEFHIFGFVSPEYMNVLRQIDKKENLIFHNEYKIEDLEEIGLKIDISIVPSIWEDCAPLVILELLALKLPVIGANIGGIPDFIIENENGFLYKYNSLEDLVRTIDKCIRNIDLIKQMRANIKLEHSFDKYVTHIISIYNTLKDANMQDPFSFELNINKTSSPAPEEHNPLPIYNQAPAPIDSETDEEFIKDYLQKAKFSILDFKIANDNELDYFDLNLIVRVKKNQNTAEISDSKLHEIEENIAIESTKEMANNNHSIPQDDIVDEMPDYQPQINIVWEGTQFVYHSLALINREQCANIIDSEVAELTIVPYENDRFFDEENEKYVKLANHDIRYKNKNLPQRIKNLPYAWIRHQWPPKDEPPVGAKWIIMQPWEFTALRKDHAEIFKMAAEIWTPSNFSRKAFIDSGIDFNKVQIIPNGIDPELFTPLGAKYPIPTLKRFKILYVGGTIYRKGIDVLLDAYLAAFSKDDDVCLIIKDIGGDSFYKGNTSKDKINEIKNNPDLPEVHYIDSHLTELEMAALYRNCDIFVSPYRGEGFSLPTLEAMACGLPVMVTKGGSTDDFVDEEVGWLIPSTSRSIGNKMDDYELTHEAYLLEPEPEEFQKMLRFVYAEPSLVFLKGTKASYRARAQWTWNLATLKMFSRLDSLYGTDMAKQAAKKLETKDDVINKFAQAVISFERKNFEKALLIFNDIILSEELPNKYKVHIYHTLALHFILNNEVEKGTQLLEIAVKDIIEHPDNKYLRAVVNAKTGNYEDVYNTLTELYDNWTFKKYDSTLGIALDDLLTLNGETSYLDGDLETAMTLFSEALKFNADNYDACYGSALCFIEVGANSEARNMLEWAIRLKPDFAEAHEEIWKLDND